MRYQVPQFIEVEDKIFGPLTFKQFIYIAGGVGLSIIFYLFLPIYIALLFILPTLVFSAALAFYKVNNKPFIFVVESALIYFFGTKLYTWRKGESEAKKVSEKEPDTTTFIPKLSDSRLKDLTWALDTKESLNPVTSNKNPQ